MVLAKMQRLGSFFHQSTTILHGEGRFVSCFMFQEVVKLYFLKKSLRDTTTYMIELHALKNKTEF